MTIVRPVRPSPLFRLQRPCLTGGAVACKAVVGSALAMLVTAGAAGLPTESTEPCVESRLDLVPDCVGNCFQLFDVDVARIDGVRHVVAAGPAGVRAWRETGGGFAEAPLPLEGPLEVRSIVLSGDLLVIGRGAQVDVLRWDLDAEAWTLEATLTVTGAPLLGTGVAVDRSPGAPERIVAGSPQIISQNPSSLVVVFRRDGGNWVIEASLAPPGMGEHAASFGSSVSIDATRMVIASPIKVGGSNPMLLVYERRGTNWSLADAVPQPASLTPPLGSQGNFGERIALRGDHLAATTGNLFQFNNVARVAIMHRGASGWTLTDVLLPEGSSTKLGADLEIFPDGAGVILAMGTRTVFTPPLVLTGARACRLFEGVLIEERAVPNPSGWGIDLVTPGVGFLPEEGAGLDGFWAAVAAPDDPEGSSVRLVGDHPTEDCDGNGAPDACSIASDPALDCNGDGILDLCQLATGVLTDENGDGIPDLCQAPICELPASAQLSSAGALAIRFGDRVALADTMLAVLERFEGPPVAPRIRIFDRLPSIDGAAWQETGVIPFLPLAASGRLSAVPDMVVTSAASGNQPVKLYRRDGGEWFLSTEFTGSGAVARGDRVAYRTTIPGLPGSVQGIRIQRLADSDWIVEQDLTGLFASGGSAEILDMDDAWLIVRVVPALGSTPELRAFRRDPERAAMPWSFVQTIPIPLPLAGASAFARAGAVDGNWLVAGTRSHVQPAQGTGCVDVFEWDGSAWVHRQRIATVGVGPNAGFGATVDMEFPWLVVGAPDDDVPLNDAGGAWLLRHDGDAFVPLRRLTIGDAPALGDALGTSVAIRASGSGAEVLMGAPFALPGSGTNQGVVAITEFDPADFIDCDDNGYDDACELELGFAVDASGDGVADACAAPSDLNGDGVVDGADLAILLAAWGGPGPGDLDGDGVVGASDLGVLLSQWTRSQDHS